MATSTPSPARPPGWIPPRATPRRTRWSATYRAGTPELAAAQIAYAMHEDHRGNLAQSRALLLAGIESLQGRRAEHARTLIDAYIMLEQQRTFLADPLPFDPLHEAEQIALETKLGKEHSSTIGALNNLGYLYHQREDLAGAERVHRELLARNVAKHGDLHRAVADSYQNLGAALTYQGRYDKSVPLHRAA